MRALDHLSRQHAGLKEFHEEMTAKINPMKAPTQESVEEAFGGNAASGISKIVPYSGYYSMDLAQGAFLSIDTNCYRVVLGERSSVEYVRVLISISLDGTTSTEHTFDANVSFDGGVLDIPGVLTLTFARTYLEGVLVTFTGTIGSAEVNGFTRYNPVPLSSFVGDYVWVEGLPPSSPALSIGSDSDIIFKGQRVTYYSYDPSMYVLMFDRESKQEVLMMGTAGAMGLACSAEGGLAVTIPEPTSPSPFE